jgi:hypothetical protein
MTPTPPAPPPRWRDPAIVILTALGVFALGQRAGQAPPSPASDQASRPMSASKPTTAPATATLPGAAPPAFGARPPSSGPAEPPPTPARMAGADPDRTRSSLQSLIEGATLAAEAVSRPDGRGRRRRARIYRTGDPSGRMPYFRVVEVLEPQPNGGFRVQSRAGMTTDTLLLKVTGDVTPETLRARVGRHGAQVLRVSPLGNFVVVGFAGGQEPWRVDEMVDRLSAEGLSQVEPNYLYFPH